MIVSSPQSVRRLARSLVRPAVYFTVITLGVEWAYRELELSRSAFTLATAGVMITALSIFLGFRLNQSYDRWWEARKQWGALVNLSRAFARKVSALVVADGVAALPDEATAAVARRDLVYRHLAWANGLRIALRHGPSVAAAPGAWDDVRPFLADAEWRRYADKANVATHLLHAQSDACRRLFGAGTAAQLAHLELQHTLDALVDVQGACERIKNTVFPWAVTATTVALVWGVATLLPFAALDAESDHDLVEIVLVVAISVAFVLVERLGEELKEPFAGRPNDTPMTALCRTIEIDLRQMLGETEVPPPVRAGDGVLM
jgi:putative membrane protein